MIYIKIHTTPEGKIVAMCDSELLGKIYVEGKRELDLSSYSGFYRGELADEKEVESTLPVSDFYTANIVGERSVGIFVKRGLASPSQAHKVKGVPYLQLFRVL